MRFKPKLTKKPLFPLFLQRIHQSESRIWHIDQTVSLVGSISLIGWLVWEKSTFLEFAREKMV
jgi:hypothetical protein